MRLAVDANVLVGQLLRGAGQAFIARPELSLTAADAVWQETEHNLHRRIAGMLRHGRINAATAAAILEQALQVGRGYVDISPAAVYLPYEAEARRRMPHDLTDWPTIAVALLLGSDIWTEDRHFHGCGVACWTTETLQRQLPSDPSARV